MTTAMTSAGAFGAPEPGTAHNEAREAIFDELLAILVDSRDDEVPADLLRKSLLQTGSCGTGSSSTW